jgi:hypothetical protein
MSNIRPFGQVSVSRVVMDSDEYGYSITFPILLGDIPEMTVVYDELTPIGSTASVETTSNGNVVNGNFQLSFLGQTTQPIPFDASPSLLRVT